MRQKAFESFRRQEREARKERNHAFTGLHVRVSAIKCEEGAKPCIIEATEIRLCVSLLALASKTAHECDPTPATPTEAHESTGGSAHSDRDVLDGNAHASELIMLVTRWYMTKLKCISEQQILVTRDCIV